LRSLVLFFSGNLQKIVFQTYDPDQLLSVLSQRINELSSMSSERFLPPKLNNHDDDDDDEDENSDNEVGIVYSALCSVPFEFSSLFRS
jgi:hypothetical protein